MHTLDTVLEQQWGDCFSHKPPKKNKIMRRILFERGIILLSHLSGLSALLPAYRQATKTSATPTGRRKPPPPWMLGAREGQASLLAGAPRHVCFACPRTLPQQGRQSRQLGLTQAVTPNQPGRAPDCNLLEGTAGLMRSSRIGSMPKIAANSPSPPGLDGSVDKSLLRRRARNGGAEGSGARRLGANLGAFSRREIQLGSQLSRDSR